MTELEVLFVILYVSIIWTVFVIETKLNEIMSKQSDVAGIATDANAKLTIALTKLNDIDAKVKALVAASNNPDADLDPATQSALDALVATVGNVSGETDTLGADVAGTPPATPIA